MEEERTIFDLIEVYFGEESTWARPFDFSKDDKDDLVKALKASTSCPYCGHGQEIDIEEWVSGAIGVKCTNCGAGDSYFVDQPEHKDANFTTIEVNKSEIEAEIESDLSSINTGKSIVVETTGIVIDESKDVQSLAASCPFIDPIDLGLITIEKI